MYDYILSVQSGKFFERNPRAAAFMGQHYQMAANVTLPRPFQAEYGIEVDAAFVVAVRDSPYNTRKKPAPLTGPFAGDREALVRAVNDAYDRVKANPHYRTWEGETATNRKVWTLHAGWEGAGLPYVPELSMAVAVDTTAAPLRLTERGVTAETDWARAWLRFHSALPLQAYNAAQGCLTPLGEAYGSLPNILIDGVEQSRARLAGLGFEVTLAAHDAERLRQRAARYERDRLPIRELAPMEYLAWFEDGPIVAKATVTLPTGDGQKPVAIPAGATYDLRVRWYRQDKVVKSEDKTAGATSKGKARSYTLRTHVDRGFLILRFCPQDTEHDGVALKPFIVEEVNPAAVKAVVDAFGLPEVKTVDDVRRSGAGSDVAAWRTRLERFMDTHQAAAGGKRLYPTQALDVARMACKSSVALLYEQGAGKTATIAHWAVVRGYRTALIVTPASVVPGIVEDLESWGLPARRLNHSLVSMLLARKRRHRLARERVKTARQRAPKLQQQLAALLGLENGEMQELAREWGLAPTDRTLHDPSPALWAGLDRIVEEKAARLEARLHREQAILQHEEQRLRLTAELARKRRHCRNLQAIRRKGKARNSERITTEIELCTVQIQDLEHDLARYYEALGCDYRPRRDVPAFYVTSYQDISLGDHLGLFDPWDHDHFDRRTGQFRGTTANIRGAKCPTCGASRQKELPACPVCGERWRGEGKGGGRVCRGCGHRAWTMGRTPLRLLSKPVQGTSDHAKRVRRERIEVLREHRLAATAGDGDDGVFLRTYHQWPLSNRIKSRLFSCVILDEGQDGAPCKRRDLRRAAMPATGYPMPVEKDMVAGVW